MGKYWLGWKEAEWLDNWRKSGGRMFQKVEAYDGKTY
jgi:hypothetical protein